MEDIYLDDPVDADKIKKRLAHLFPGLTVFHYDFQHDYPEGLDSADNHSIVFNTTYYADKAEFGFCISIYRTPPSDTAERALFIALSFSIFLRERVLVPFTHPDAPDDPYYAIVFENGKIFLADDSDTSFGDGTNGQVKILQEYPLAIPLFDGRAERINE